ncbi:MAG TPA: Cj0069 family protein [Acidimicrobiales bacterium]|jgi:hypothetical protein|nr:Cj0069 family protein [Acidimicrobiales bacterium]
MDHSDERFMRIGILWRGDRNTEPPLPRPDRQLGPLFEAFARLPVTIVPIQFADNAVDEVREQLFTCDGVLVWVNPIQDGANRALLDPLLREVSTNGIFVSANPDVILKLGTKEVLFHTRELGWGSDTALYRSIGDLEDRFPERLSAHERLVLKQARGNGGNGVWKVELVEIADSDVGADQTVRVQDARVKDGSSELMKLKDFMDRCEQYFAWSGSLVDQEYQERLGDGMLRCYFTHDEVVGFARQWPKGLLDPTESLIENPPTAMEGPDVPAYQRLRVKAESEWVPQMITVLGLERESLPVIWDADFFFGAKDAAGEDTYVLCEINVSAVWPFPSMASEKVATATLTLVQAARAARKT